MYVRMHEISLAAEKIFELWGQPITNSLITTVIVSALIIMLALLYNAKKKLIPSKLQSVIELPVEAMYNLSKQISPDHAKEFFPLITTIFLFVLISNWFGLLPGLTGIGIVHEAEATETVEHAEEEEDHPTLTPLFRATTADLNTTIALALVSVGAAHYYGIKNLGIGTHLKKFFNTSNPINFFVGILELISEVSKIISFSFRLFGNIFAGEVLLLVMGALIPLLVPVPFIGLEIFVGFIQALVFAMLTLVFCTIATQHH